MHDACKWRENKLSAWQYECIALYVCVCVCVCVGEQPLASDNWSPSFHAAPLNSCRQEAKMMAPSLPDTQHCMQNMLWKECSQCNVLLLLLLMTAAAADCTRATTDSAQ